MQEEDNENFQVMYTLFQQNFFDLMEEIFLGKTKKYLDPVLIEKVNEKIKSLNLNASLIHYLLRDYLRDVFGEGLGRTTDYPLHNDRDYALEIYAKVFSSYFPLKGEDKYSRVSLVFFLSGFTGYLHLEGKAEDKIGLQVQRFANSNKTILIYGETGTGKELIAKSIHYLSPRLKDTFLAINCSGLTESLLETQLFGVVKGAATGVTQDREGIFEAVGNGTLFLDEIGDMPMPTQNQLLRVLETGEFYRVGDYKKKRKFTGRIIAATNKDLKTEIKIKNFREDVYYRLSVLPLELPSLRSYEPKQIDKFIFTIFRKLHDIPKPGEKKEYERIQIAVDRKGGTYFDNPHNPYISDEVLKVLENYPWPGNFRELRNVMERAYIEADGERIEVRHLPEDVRQHEQTKISPMVSKDGDGIAHVPVSKIIEYADQEKAKIVARKIEQIYRGGGNLKKALASEGLKTISEYNGFGDKLKRILGKERFHQFIFPDKKS